MLNTILQTLKFVQLIKQWKISPQFKYHFVFVLIFIHLCEQLMILSNSCIFPYYDKDWFFPFLSHFRDTDSKEISLESVISLLSKVSCQLTRTIKLVQAQGPCWVHLHTWLKPFKEISKLPNYFSDKIPTKMLFRMIDIYSDINSDLLSI